MILIMFSNLLMDVRRTFQQKSILKNLTISYPTEAPHLARAHFEGLFENRKVKRFRFKTEISEAIYLYQRPNLGI
jgi:hypothetical protein